VESVDVGNRNTDGSTALKCIFEGRV